MIDEEADGFVLVGRMTPRVPRAVVSHGRADQLWHAFHESWLVGARLADQFKVLCRATAEELVEIKDSLVCIALQPSPVCWYDI